MTCIPDEWLSTTEPGLQAGFTPDLLIGLAVYLYNIAPVLTNPLI